VCNNTVAMCVCSLVADELSVQVRRIEKGTFAVSIIITITKQNYVLFLYYSAVLLSRYHNYCGTEPLLAVQ